MRSCVLTEKIKFGFDVTRHQLSLDAYALLDSSQADQVFTPFIPQIGSFNRSTYEYNPEEIFLGSQSIEWIPAFWRPSFNSSTFCYRFHHRFGPWPRAPEIRGLRAAAPSENHFLFVHFISFYTKYLRIIHIKKLVNIIQ